MKIRIGRGRHVAAQAKDSEVLSIKRRPGSEFYDVLVRWNEETVTCMNPAEVTMEMMASEGLDAFCVGNWRSMVKVGVTT